MATNPIKDPRYTFETEWYDPQADIVREYRLFYFPVNNEIAMYDKKMCRDFVKRVECPKIDGRCIYYRANTWAALDLGKVWDLDIRAL